jgi:predicted nucleotidyltransferase
MTSLQALNAITAGVLSALEAENRLQEATVILVGSVARNAETEESDIDILVIEPRRGARVVTEPRVQLFAMTRRQFLDRLRAGDDFPHWVVRFGRVLSDLPDWWSQLLSHPCAQAWPDWRRKLKQAESRLSFASRLLASGDEEHAQEEYLLAIRHLARGVLLKRADFPHSQPELARQLRRAGCSDLANALDKLSSTRLTSAALARHDERLRRWLDIEGDTDLVSLPHRRTGT